MIEDSLFSALLRLSRRLSRQLNAELRDVELTGEQAVTLDAIDADPAPRVTDLCLVLGLDASTVSANLALWPPQDNGRWTAIGRACGIEAEMTAELKKRLRPGLDAIIRWLGVPLAAEERRLTKPTVRPDQIAPAKKAASARSTKKTHHATVDGTCAPSASTPRGPAPKPIRPSQNHYSKRQKIRRAFGMHWSIICVGLATHIGSFTAPLFI